MTYKWLLMMFLVTELPYATVAIMNTELLDRCGECACSNTVLKIGNDSRQEMCGLGRTKHMTTTVKCTHCLQPSLILALVNYSQEQVH